MNDAITINTRFNTDEIRQELRSSDDIRGNVHEYIMKLRDHGVREALKKLGWTPPGEESAQNQLYARIEELEQERGALAAHVERLREGHERAFSTLRWGWLQDLLDETPETSLTRLKAEWQAEALGAYEYYIHGDHVTFPRTPREFAEELRRQAEERSDDHE